MTTVIGVRFKKAGKVYYFAPGEVWPQPGDYVVVETSRGVELGEVIAGAREVEDDQIIAPLKQVIRVATPEDVHRAEFNESREKDAYHICQERISEHKLEMKLVDVEYTFDGTKIIFYFTANGRIDFRELVKDLAAVFKMRIELRQIGVRDEAKMLGGLGSCGRPICCGAFLSDFQPVSIKMAKEQNLSLNPTKISGQCGRLMCCLKYEQDNYETALKRLPRQGREGMTPDGPGVIVDINVIREKVRARIHNHDGSFEVREYNIEDVSKMVHGEGGEAAHRQPPREAAEKREGAEGKEAPSGENRPPRSKKPRPPRDGQAKENGAAPVREGPSKDAPRKDTQTPAPPAKDRAKDHAPVEDEPKDDKAEKPRRRSTRPKGPKQSTDEYLDNLKAQRTAEFRAGLPEKFAVPSAPPDDGT